MARHRRRGPWYELRSLPGEVDAQGRPLTALARAIAEEGRRKDWLAAAVGRSKPWLSDLLAGRRRIAWADAKSLAAMLDRDPTSLFERVT